MKKLDNDEIKNKITSKEELVDIIKESNSLHEKRAAALKLQNEKYESVNPYVEKDIQSENSSMFEKLGINSTTKFNTIPPANNIGNYVTYNGDGFIYTSNNSTLKDIAENIKPTQIKKRRSIPSFEPEEELDENKVSEYLRNSILPIEKLKSTNINKSEEIYINYNELADRLTVNSLKEKYKEDYNELKHIKEYNDLLNKYINIILEHERKDE